MYLGIDLGTSSVKTILIDENQTVIGSASANLSVQRPHDGWSEQHPADWIQAVENTLDSLHQTHTNAMRAVKGIGLSGHMHGATLLGDNDDVLRPCMLWNDTRSHEQAHQLDTPRCRELSGNILFPGFTAPKVAWVAEHESDVFGRIQKILLPKDYVRLWLTGEHVAEMSDAAGTGWLDTGQRDWSDELLNASALQPNQMPRLVEGTEVSGELRKSLAQRFGMNANVVVAGGAGDNAASACGMGTIQPGSAFLSLGTSGVLFAANEAYKPNADSAVHTFCHAIPDTWHQMGVILAATDALNWLAGTLGSQPGALTEVLGVNSNEPTPLLFLPYLGGERTPINDANARGVFMGLKHQTDTAELTRAVLQGVAFAFKDCQMALAEAGTQLSRAAAIGGGANSRYWLQTLANTLDLTLDIPTAGDFGASLGAARLGLIAAESSDPTEVCIPPEVIDHIEPSNTDAYLEHYERYKATYRALKPIM